MYLYGPSGNRKTHLAAAAVNRLIAQRRAVLFATAPELLAMIRKGFDGGQAENLIGLCQRVSFGPAHRHEYSRWQDRPVWWWTIWGRNG